MTNAELIAGVRKALANPATRIDSMGGALADLCDRLEGLEKLAVASAEAGIDQRQRANRAEAKTEQLRRALLKYGRHETACPLAGGSAANPSQTWPCHCGLNEVAITGETP